VNWDEIGKFWSAFSIETPPNKRGYSGGCHVAWAPNSSLCAVAMDSCNMIVIDPKLAKMVFCDDILLDTNTTASGLIGTTGHGSGRIVEFSPKFPEIPILVCGLSNGFTAVFNTNSWTRVRTYSFCDKKEYMGGMAFDPRDGIHMFFGLASGVCRIPICYPTWSTSMFRLYPKDFRAQVFTFLLINNRIPFKLPIDVVHVIISHFAPK